jgi:hypothetical protein
MEIFDLEEKCKPPRDWGGSSEACLHEVGAGPAPTAVKEVDAYPQNSGIRMCWNHA